MKTPIVIGLAALALAAPAVAQDAATPAPADGMSTTTTDTTATTTSSGGTMASSTGATAPDGSRAFGIEPYFGLMGGYHSFDRDSGVVGSDGPRFDGALVEGVLGVNVPLGPLVVGIEGHGAKGFGDIDWEYGARARAGFRAGETGLIYASYGYTWIEAKNNRGFADRDDWVYGLGVEVGPKDIGLGGLTGNAGARLRLSVESYDLKSVRPMAGVIFHF